MIRVYRQKYLGGIMRIYFFKWKIYEHFAMWCTREDALERIL
jgi:hypothetical protein